VGVTQAVWNGREMRVEPSARALDQLADPRTGKTERGEEGGRRSCSVPGPAAAAGRGRGRSLHGRHLAGSEATSSEGTGTSRAALADGADADERVRVPGDRIRTSAPCLAVSDDHRRRSRPGEMTSAPRSFPCEAAAGLLGSRPPPGDGQDHCLAGCGRRRRGAANARLRPAQGVLPASRLAPALVWDSDRPCVAGSRARCDGAGGRRREVFGMRRIGAALSVKVRLWRRPFAARTGSPRGRLYRPRGADLCDGWKAVGVHVDLFAGECAGCAMWAPASTREAGAEAATW
jgi:hypothetical protein